VEFEWDPAKDSTNRARHGVSFAEAATIFGDPLSIAVDDPDHSIDEDRYLTIGRSRSGRLLIVAHTDRDGRVRIVSARELTRAERVAYEDGT
jgi:uncharacterized DUF497 family protein